MPLITIFFLNVIYWTFKTPCWCRTSEIEYLKATQTWSKPEANRTCVCCYWSHDLFPIASWHQWPSNAWFVIIPAIGTTCSRTFCGHSTSDQWLPMWVWQRILILDISPLMFHITLIWNMELTKGANRSQKDWGLCRQQKKRKWGTRDGLLNCPQISPHT